MHQQLCFTKRLLIIQTYIWYLESICAFLWLVRTADNFFWRSFFLKLMKCNVVRSRRFLFVKQNRRVIRYADAAQHLFILSIVLGPGMQKLLLLIYSYKLNSYDVSFFPSGERWLLTSCWPWKTKWLTG